MTRFLFALFLVAELLALVAGADPPKQSIRLPELPSPAPPAPMPTADAVMTLTPGVLFVISSDYADVIVLASPKGLVSIRKTEGPILVYGKFIEAPNLETERKFSDKGVWIIKGTHTGRVELLLVPPGAKGEEDVIRRTIDVDMGEGPRPPPKPPEPKPPEPVEPTSDAPIKLPGFRVLFVYESQKPITQKQHSAMFGRSVEDYLNRKTVKGADGRTPEWRRLDPNDEGSPHIEPHWSGAIKLAVSKGIPAVVVSDGKTGYVESIPADVDPAAFLKKLKTVGGE